MKILVVADEESRKIWDYFEPGMLDKYDLILSCGDLSPRYLSFLVTMSHADVIYVHGNHDDKYEKIPPEGCICADGKLINYKGVRILGLGGSIKYRVGVNMYTQKEMDRRVRKLRFSLWRNKGFDILLTHAPAEGVNDGPDYPHQGFAAFTQLMERYEPKFFIHGHVHQTYGGKFKRVDAYKKTTVINGFKTYELDYPD